MNLTPRQRQVTELICAGLADKEIADKLGLACCTVNYHARAAVKKSGARNRPHLACLFLRSQGSSDAITDEDCGRKKPAARRGDAFWY